MPESKKNHYPCPRCSVGRCHHHSIPFVDMYQGQLLSIPNTPAYICDVCHFAEFERQALELLWEALEIDKSIDDYQSFSDPNYHSPFGD